MALTRRQRQAKLPRVLPVKQPVVGLSHEGCSDELHRRFDRGISDHIAVLGNNNGMLAVGIST